MNPILNLSDKKKNYAIFGMLLGDAWIQNRAHPTRNKQLVFEHSIKQQDYLEWKEYILKNWGLFRTSTYNIHKQTTFGPLIISRVIADIPDIRHFLKFNRFYNETGSKLISEYVMRRITPLGLLFWFLDDGTLTINKRSSTALNPKYGGYKISRFATIATYNFNEKDHQIAQKWFDKRFGIDVRIHHWNPKSKNRSYLKLYMSATSFRQFYDLVKPYLQYIPKSMQYKFNMQYNPERSNESSFLDYNLSSSAVLSY